MWKTCESKLHVCYFAFAGQYMHTSIWICFNYVDFDSGLITPSGLSSIPTGLETPEMIELRKKNIEDTMDQGGETPALYTVLPEKKTAVGGAMMGSAHVYDIGAATAVSNLYQIIH